MSGGKFMTCVVQFPICILKEVQIFIDGEIEMQRTEKLQKRITPSRCYITNEYCVMVWRAIYPRDPFMDMLCDKLSDMCDAVGDDFIFDIYDQDEIRDNKIYRCIPEVPNALCVQYWKLDSIGDIPNKEDMINL